MTATFFHIQNVSALQDPNGFAVRPSGFGCPQDDVDEKVGTGVLDGPF